MEELRGDGQWCWMADNREPDKRWTEQLFMFLLEALRWFRQFFLLLRTHTHTHTHIDIGANTGNGSAGDNTG